MTLLAKNPILRRLLGLFLPLFAFAGTLACRSATDSSARMEARLEGRVVSVNGRRLPKIDLLLVKEELAARSRWPDAGTVEHLSARSNEEGAFILVAPVPGRYILRASGKGFAPAEIPIILIPRETVSSVLRLDPLDLLEGQVIDIDGKPVHQALIFAWPAEAAGKSVLETRSGTDGRFALPGVSRGVWSLLAEAPGFGTLRIERLQVPARDLILKLEGEARSLGGEVVGSDGKSRVGAKVIVGGPGIPVPRQQITNDKGLFMFHGLGPGRYVVRAFLDTQVSPAIGITIDESTGWLPPVRLRLTAGISLSGRAVNERGAPVAAATVELATVPPDDAPTLVVTDAQGQFRIGPMPGGRYQLVARAPLHSPAFKPEIVLPAAAAAFHEMRLPRSATVHGQVKDAQGHPVAGIEIAARPPPERLEILAVVPGLLPPASEVADRSDGDPQRDSPKRTTRTDAQGRFELTSLPAGALRLRLEAPGGQISERDLSGLRPGDNRDLGVLTLEPKTPLTGRVVGADGVPVAGARVEAFVFTDIEAPGALMPAARTFTDDTGLFRLSCPLGRIAVGALMRGREPHFSAVVYLDGKAPPTPVELRLAPATALLDGEIRSSEGHLVPHAVVTAYALVEGRTLSAMATVTSTRQGVFRLPLLPRNRVMLEVRHPRGGVSRREVTPPDHMSVVLPPR